MYHKIVNLTEDAKLHIYVPDIRMNPKPRDGMLVIPGGGYGFVSMDREGEPVALWFCGMGVNCFILEYAIGEKAKFPTPLRDAALAMAHIKENAEAYDVDPQRIFTVGFSAGGHLAASLGCFWNREDLTGVAAQLARPTGMALIYPVISGGPYRHRGTLCRACGTQEPTQEQLDALSLEKQVTKDTVPAFLAHTATDKAVPVENTLLMAMALSREKIPMEVHILPKGNHGLALANPITAAEEAGVVPEFAQWTQLCLDWMRRTV